MASISTLPTRETPRTATTTGDTGPAGTTGLPAFRYDESDRAVDLLAVASPTSETPTAGPKSSSRWSFDASPC